MSQAPPNIAILQNHSLTMLVQRELERMVLAGELAAGEKLNELALAERSASRAGRYARRCGRSPRPPGPAREERGVFVREISVTEADEIYELRATLDQMAGRKLAQAIRPEQLEELRAVVKRMQDAAIRDDREATTSRTCDFTTRWSSSPAMPS